MKRLLASLIMISLVIVLCIPMHRYQSVEAEVAHRYLSPLDIVSDGNRLYIAEATAGEIAVFDQISKTVTAHYTLPKNPTGLVLSQDKSKIYVTAGSSNGKVYVLTTATGVIEQTIDVGHTPMSPVLSPDGQTLYVCNRFDDNVAIINLTTNNQILVPVLREAYGSAITQDGAYLYVINHIPVGPSNADYVGASVTVINTINKSVQGQIQLPNGSGSVKDICMSPDGNYMYLTHVLARYAYPTTQLDRGWINTNALSIIDTTSKSLYNTILVDDVDHGAANPWGVTCTADGQSLVIAHAGSQEVSIIDRIALMDKLQQVHAGNLVTPSLLSADRVPNDLGFLGDMRKRIQIQGNGPRGITVVGNMVYVGEYFSDSVGMVDMDTLETDSISLADTLAPMDEARTGEMIWNDATRCFQQWESCSSCHPDARVDGLNWDNLNDGLGDPKNAKSMMLSYLTPPVMVTGVRPDTEGAIRKGLQFIEMSVPNDEEVAAVYKYLQSLQPTPSPALESDGSLSASALRGKDIFEGSAGCIGCHTPPLYTNMKLRKVGTNTDIEDRSFDVPSLMEAWRSGPYLHDGRATTIREVFTTYNINNQHGNTSSLTESQLDDLEQYILSICDISGIVNPTASYMDNYDDGNANGWTTYGDTWQVANEQYQVSGTTEAIAIANNTNFYDVIYDADVTLQGNTGGAGMIFRVTSPGEGSNMYRGYGLRVTATRVELGYVNNGWTEIGGANVSTPTGSNQHIKVTAVDSHIRVYVADMITPVIDVTDAHYKWGAIGLMTTNCEASFDNVNVRKYVAPPLRPTGLTATVEGQDMVTLGWASVSGASEGYYVYRAESSDGSYNRLTNTPIQETNYQDQGLTEGTTYYYKVTSSNEGGESNLTNYASATIDPPSIPTGITATSAGLDTIDISYTASTGAEGYDIYRATVADGEYTKITMSPVTETIYKDTGLSHSTTYYYKVSAISSSGQSLLSEAISGMTASPISETYLDNFDDGNSNGWTTYGGSWQVTGGAYEVSANPGAKSIANNTSFTDFTYETDITIGPSGNAGVIFRASHLGEGPDAYAGYYVGISTSNIVLGKANQNWNMITAQNISISSGNNHHLKVVAIGTQIKIYIDDMVNPKIETTDTSHQVGNIGLRTYNCNATFDNISVIKEGIMPPTTPTNLTAETVGENGINLSYTTVDGATGYNVYKSGTSDGTYSKVTDNPITSLTYSDTGLVAGTTYYYKVTAVNQAGESSQTECVSATTESSIPPISDRYEDNFDNGNSQGWITYGGIWQVSNGGYVVEANPGAKSLADRTLFTDFTYEADITIGASGNAGVIFRASNLSEGADAYNGYYVGISTSGIELGKASHNWELIESHNMTVSAATVHHMKVEVIGTRIKVYVDNMTTPKIEVTDTTHNSGAIGLRTYNCQATFDNISVIKEGLATPTVPTAPTDLTATSSGVDTINLSYTAVSDVTGYHVYRSDASDGTYTKITDQLITTITYSDIGLTAGTTYYYIVTATNNVGESDQSDSVSATTDNPAPPGYSDDYDDGDANDWTTYGGSWTVTNNQYKVNQDAGVKAMADNQSFDNFTYEGDIIIGSSGNAGFIFRVTEPAIGADAYKGYYVGISTTKVEMGKADQGWTELANYPTSLAADTIHHVKIAASVNNIKVYVDNMDSPVINVTDATYTVGGIGLRTWQCNATFDNISVEVMN